MRATFDISRIYRDAPRSLKDTLRNPLLSACLLGSFLAAHGMAAPPPLVSLDATQLPAGPLVSWPNTGSLGGNFTSDGLTAPSVASELGVMGVRLNGTQWYVGPIAPAQITGNGARAAWAWIYNPSVAYEESIIAWGRRGGPNGTNSAFTHGNHSVWGALGMWGDKADVSWNGAAEEGIWTFVAFSYDPATSTATVYTNGVESNSEINGPLNTWAISSLHQPLPFALGVQNQENGNRDFGAIPASLTIAKVEVFDTTLTPEEVAAAFNQDAPTFGRQTSVSIREFKATPDTILRGESSTLSWTILGATSVSLSPAVEIPEGAASVSVSPTTTTTYTLTASGPGSSQTKQVTVAVNENIPFVPSQDLRTGIGEPLSLTLTADNPEFADDEFEWVVLSQPAHGTLTGTPPHLQYTPAAAYEGADSFTFQARKNGQSSNTAQVHIVVDYPPAPPDEIRASASIIGTDIGDGRFVGQLASRDPNTGDTHSYELVSGEGDDNNAWFSISGSQLISRHNFSDAEGTTVKIRVRTTDSSGLSHEQMLEFPVARVTRTVVINEIQHNAPYSGSEYLELHNPTEETIDLSGWKFTRGISYTFPSGTGIAPGAYLVLAGDAARFSSQFGFAPAGVFTGKLSSDGETVELRDASGAVADTVSYKAEFPWPIGAGKDEPASMELLNPFLDNDLGGSWRTALQPTPGGANSVYTANAPPQIRQVKHNPVQPKSEDPITITAKITDPHGVGEVKLWYQIVAPGEFIPAYLPRTVSQILANPDGPRIVNPAFESPQNWSYVVMRDDGSGGDAVAADNTYTAVLPALPHRTLLRYRIEAADLQSESVRVPYADDDSLNFACFVYDGVPDYVASTRSVSPEGRGKVWPSSLLTSVPVYHWIIRNRDMMALQAYNSNEQFPNNGTANVLKARRVSEWEGALVYDGIVYDHITARLRGGNSRYGDNENRFLRGKRHYKFKFHRGNRFQAKGQDGKPLPEKWSRMAVSKMFGNKGGNDWGLPYEVGARLWSEFGVPAPRTFWFQFRVIDGAAEARDQYDGDFWGIQQVVEEYRKDFLTSRNLAKGNLYKLSDWIWDAEPQRRYQAKDMVNDGSEFNNIRDNLHGGQNANWLNRYVNYDKWYRYNAVAEAIRHYDIFPYTSNIRHALKNQGWYFAPEGPDPSRGVVQFLPYDWDASFGPNWNNGWDHANNALYGQDMSTSHGMRYIDKPGMKIEHRNVLREFRDLIWQPDQLNGLIDHRAAVIAQLSMADQDRWRNAPIASGTAIDDPLPVKVQSMKDFAFTGWSGSSGPTVPAGGRAVYLDEIANQPDAGRLPATPTITYTGGQGHPVNGLSFGCSAFSAPQGAGTFAGMAWRIGQIYNPNAPNFDPADGFVMEYKTVWESGVLPTYQNAISVPAGVLRPGLTYRARVRMQSNTGRWSHWSAPYEFTTTLPGNADDLTRYLVVSEIHYHPAPPSTPAEMAATGDKNDFEFLEFMNISKDTWLDLDELAITAGVSFSFADSAITSLAPGGYVLVVKNLAAFEARYGTGLPVAGQYDGKLDNAGETITLETEGVVVRSFAYSDKAPWPTEPDGFGPSLVLIAPESNPDHGNGLNWRASYLPNGSPGVDDANLSYASSPWRNMHFNAAELADPAISGPDADPDGDGLSNLLEYALGLDPHHADIPSPVALVTVPDPGATRYALRFRRRNPALGISYQPETSADLRTWLAGPESLEQIGQAQPNGDGTETVTFRALEASDGQLFYRLRVIVPGE